MAFFIFMFCCNLFIPLAMIVGGYIMYKFPPKETNGLLGYRTKMSRKNQDTWKFAHDYCGRLWLKVGVITLILSILVQLPFSHAGDDAFGICTILLESVQIIIMLVSILPVEKALKRNFDENGNARERVSECR